MLGDHATQSLALDYRAFERYISQHHDSWYAFAISLDHAIEAEDIVLVSGWLKTSDWALAVCTNHGHAHEVLLEAHPSSTAGVQFEATLSQDVDVSVDQRRGPLRDEPRTDRARPRDQCLFLRYYKLKKRPVWRARCVPAGELSDDAHPEDEDDDTRACDSRTPARNTEISVTAEAVVDDNAYGTNFDAWVQPEPGKVVIQVRAIPCNYIYGPSSHAHHRRIR